MALVKVGLGSITQVAAATTNMCILLDRTKTVYIRNLEIHSLDASNVANVQVHVVPVSGGSRNGSSITRIMRLGIYRQKTHISLRMHTPSH